MPYADAILADSPLLYLPLQGDANDASGNGRNFATNGTVAWNRVGPLEENTAANVLNVTDGDVRRAHEAWMDLTGDFTYELWIYATSETGYQTLWSKASSGGVPTTIEMRRNNGTALITIWGSSESTTGITHPSANTWHHVAVTRSGTSVQWYVDGAALGNPAAPAAPATNTDELQIGRRNDNGNPWKGSFCHAAVFGTALGAKSIANHYDAAFNRWTKKGSKSPMVMG